MASDLLLVFLKAPRPGAVKTRLASRLGPEAASDIYRALAEAEVRGTEPRRGEYDRLFCFSPPDAGAEMAAWFPGEDLVAQEGTDLGERMTRAFEEGFRRGAARVAIVGGDVPWVSGDTVAAAFRALAEHDVVLGPARDGGYYLLALARPQPGLFRGIAWGTGSVLAATVERASALGLAVRCLETLPDIDTVEDVRSEWERLGPILDRRPGLRDAVAAILAR